MANGSFELLRFQSQFVSIKVEVRCIRECAKYKSFVISTSSRCHEISLQSKAIL